MRPNWREAARALLREPLLHFLVAGALVFWLLSGRPPDLGERRIIVNQQVVSRLVQRWNDSFHRLPTQEETDGLIRDYVADQVYYREALGLGLDRDDEVVIKRMRRKLESMAVADAEAASPSDAELQALIDRDPARYAADPKMTFDQVYLGADTPALRGSINALLDQARKGHPPASVPAPLASHFDAASGDQIAATFGDEFATSVEHLPSGDWTGPVASGLGLHLVRVTARAGAGKPDLASVRQRVENDWRAAAVAKAQADAYARILKGYDVVIEQPK